MSALLDLAFPPACLACDRVLEPPHAFCEGCAVSLAPLGAQVCVRCGEPDTPAGTACVRCQRRPPPFLCAWAPFAHEGALARAIHRFKYEDHPELARPLVTWALPSAQALLAKMPEASVVLAIPLHRQRLRTRMYDQAQLLARELAQQTSHRWLGTGLSRVRATERQVGLTEIQREDNVRHAFVADGSTAGMSVLLVDDVLTTGATARAAALALLEAGATDVRVLTLARAFGGG